MAPTPALLPGASHGQRSSAGWCPRGREESDTTERACTHARVTVRGATLIKIQKHRSEVSQPS